MCTGTTCFYTIINCTQYDECTVDCSSIAPNTTNLGCMYSTIYCASNCSVHCGYNACVNTTVYYAESLDMQCSGSSGCVYATMYPYVDGASYLNLECSGIGACIKAAVDISAGSALDIDCSAESPYANFTTPACWGIRITMASESSLNMECGANWACVLATVSASSSSTLDILCDDELACMGMDVFDHFNSAINIMCSGEDGDQSCLGTVVTATNSSTRRSPCSVQEMVNRTRAITRKSLAVWALIST